MNPGKLLPTGRGCSEIASRRCSREACCISSRALIMRGCEACGWSFHGRPINSALIALNRFVNLSRSASPKCSSASYRARPCRSVWRHGHAPLMDRLADVSANCIQVVQS